MKKHLAAFIIFVILITTLTFPLVFKITAFIPGYFSTDEIYAPIWESYRLKLSLLNHLPIGETNLIAYPFGIEVYKNQPIGYLLFLINVTLALFTTPVLTYNLQIIFNFLLAALFSYLLVYYLTRNKLVSILSGIIFGFSPYMFVRSWQHYGETYQWPMPLFLWFLFRLQNENTRRTKILYIVSSILTTITFGGSYYISIIFLLFFVYLIFRGKGKDRYIKRIIILTVIAFFIVSIQFLPVFMRISLLRHSIPSAQNIYHRPFEDIFVYSARQLSYFLPTVVHPIFGKFTQQFAGSQLYGVSFTEHTLYLGWTPLILAFIAFRKWRKAGKLHAEESFYIGFFVLLAIVAWFFSQPPWWQWGSLRLYMPSFFMYKILPPFRAYCRFGIVVMLSVSVLAGFGLKFVLEKFSKQKTKIAIAAIFCSLVLFEFWNYPPFKVIDVSKVPDVYYWLKDQPGDFTIAEYPLITNCPIELYKFYQTKHEKKIINGSVNGTYANKIANTITKLSDPKTAAVLKWLGVKYVFVHRDAYLNSELEEINVELNNISKNLGLKLVKTFPPQECPRANIMCVQKSGPVDVYEVVVPQPIKPPVKE